MERRLGVTRATLGSDMLSILFLGLVYFGVSLWDGFSTAFSSATGSPSFQIVFISLLDACVYYYILHSLLETIRELEAMKQTSKLEVFVRLRGLFIVAIVLCTAYNLVFCYLIYTGILEQMWKWTWFFSHGVWTLFQLAVVCIVMVVVSEIGHV